MSGGKLVRLPTADSALETTLAASVAANEARAKRAQWARTVTHIREAVAKASEVHYAVVRERGIGKLREDTQALAITGAMLITALEALVEALDKEREVGR